MWRKADVEIYGCGDIRMRRYTDVEIRRMRRWIACSKSYRNAAALLPTGGHRHVARGESRVV